MNNQDSQQDFDQSSPVHGSDKAEHLTTADMAAASAPARSTLGKTEIGKEAAKEDVANEHDQQESGALNSEQDFEPLFGEREGTDLRSRWFGIQAAFVDEPRKSVEQADELVAAAIKRLAEMFAAERRNLEEEWESGDDVSTEDLRVALRRYRSFFDRLLSV